ncbi:MAG: DsbA family protein [Rhodobacteraceae bacterium]|nr:DsbA family protein [Paracoccaceae bacterium]
MFRNLFPSLIVLALAVGGSYAWVQSRSGPAEPQYADLAAIEQVVDVQATDGVEVVEMSLGAEDAPITIVEYASFTCPHCATYHKDVFGRLKAEYVDTGKARIVIRDVYFDRFGLWAAMLARCGGAEKFFGVSDLIYNRQREWTSGESNAEIVQNLMKLGRLAGMEDDQMNACLQDNAMAQALVAEYQKNAEADDINSTPSFVINGKKYANMAYPDFKDTLDGLLAE